MMLYNWSHVFKTVLHGTNMCAHCSKPQNIEFLADHHHSQCTWKCVLIPYARTIHEMESLLRGISSSCDTSKLRQFHACFIWRLKVDNDRREVNVRWNASCARYQCMINLARKLRILALSWCESFSKAKVLWKMKISRMERTFEAFWRQVFDTEFDYTK